MKIKKLTHILLASSLCLTPLTSFAVSNDSMTAEPQISVEDVNLEENQNASEEPVEEMGLLYDTVYLSLKLSHANSHRSYTKIVTRQGKKYEVTYVAIPKSECSICKNDILR